MLVNERVGKINMKSTTVLMLLLVLAGCGGGTGTKGGGSNTVNPVPVDSVSPTVTGMTPVEDSTDFGINGTLTATFSEAMNPAGMTPDNFRVTDEANSIAGTVSYDATNHIVVFTPNTSLSSNVRYTATIITGIKDLGNNTVNTDFAWCFTTGVGMDITPPGVTATVPANAEIAVATNRKLAVSFSKDMNSSTLTPASFNLTGPAATVVSGSVRYVDRTAIFTPAQNLVPNSSYTATITTSVTDLAGNAIPANTAWSFVTGASADAVAPITIAASPANSATGVATNSKISVSFNEPMDPATINTANLLLTAPGALPVLGTVTFDPSTNTASFTRINHLITPVAFHPTPVNVLEPDTTYTATLTTGVKDLAGNPLAANMVWSFSTAP